MKSFGVQRVGIVFTLAVALAAALPYNCSNPSYTFASCFGFDPVDATPYLQAALNSSASLVIYASAFAL